MFHLDDLTDFSDSKALGTDPNLNDGGSPEISDALNKHRANIERFA